MPGLLRPDATCPCCNTPLIAIVDTTTRATVTREYFHEKASPKARRKRRCIRKYRNNAETAAERRALEVRCFK